jgi:tRNA-dihydrouridine synthase B
MRIGSLKIENGILAPMSGVTDIGFRTVCKEAGASLVFTEMVSAKGLFYKNKATFELLRKGRGEGLVGVQLFGSEPAVFKEVAGHDEIQKFDIIDINMGCSVKKIIKNNEGSALMKDIRLSAKILSGCVRAGKTPVSAKIRAGFFNNDKNCADLAKALEDAGACAITVHPRTAEQMFKGRAEPELIARVKAAVKIPVIASGDIFSKDDYFNIISLTGCDGAMAARGALGNPFIFSEIAGRPLRADLSLKKRTILRQIEIMKEYYNERYIVCNMRKHVAWFLKGEANSKIIKDKLNSVISVEELAGLVRSLDV